MYQSVCYDPFVAPTPGFPCLVGLYVSENSPRYLWISNDILLSNHIEFDFNIAESFTTVNSNNSTNHFWEYDCISLVCLYGFWFLSSWAFCFSFSNLINSFIIYFL